MSAIKSVDDLKAIRWCSSCAVMVLLVSGCQSELPRDPGLERPDESLATSHALNQAETTGAGTVGAAGAGGAERAGARSTDQELEDLVVSYWSASAMGCGLGGSTPPSPEEVMASVPAAERASVIHDVLVRVPLSAPRMSRLLELLGATPEPDAMRFMNQLWPRIPELLDRYNREVYEPQMASAGYPRRVSGTDRADLIGHVRVGAVRGAAQVHEATAIPLLVEALSDPDVTVRAESIVALAGRSDFSDRAQLMAARDSLPVRRPAVEAALGIEL